MEQIIIDLFTVYMWQLEELFLSVFVQPHHGSSSDNEASANVFLAKLAGRQSVSRNVTICATPFLTNAEAFTPGKKFDLLI